MCSNFSFSWCILQLQLKSFKETKFYSDQAYCFTNTSIYLHTGLHSHGTIYRTIHNQSIVHLLRFASSEPSEQRSVHLEVSSDALFHMYNPLRFQEVSLQDTSMGSHKNAQTASTPYIYITRKVSSTCHMIHQFLKTYLMKDDEDCFFPKTYLVNEDEDF